MSQPRQHDDATDDREAQEDTGTSVSGAGRKVSSRLPSAEDPPPRPQAGSSSQSEAAEDDDEPEA
jgi:hypothetical protein